MYDPSLRALVSKCDQDWGVPEQNRSNLVPYPIPAFSRALYGIDIINGELIAIVGPEKQRKTTFALNILHHLYTSELPRQKPKGAFFTLESGAPPERVRDSLIAMEATRLLYLWKLSGRTVDLEREAVISADFLRYNRRTPLQYEAIEQAKEIVASWPVDVYGPSIHQGNARDLAACTALMEQEAKSGCRIMWIDHAQAFTLVGYKPHEKLDEVVSSVADVITRYRVACILISQVSLTSIREARQGLGSIIAFGGKRLNEEANVVFVAEYPKRGLMKLSIEMTRRGESCSVEVPINPPSGLILPNAQGKEVL